ncbi:DUF1565 domain-containing protein [Zavarzinia sp. CC-PAN008]|uniref:DUF1565 domain-containing protein n=1 Tax=Zavarzinia sp. CC-PAN008 TaxID=3243332 RepID=UPI003F749804
MVHRMAALAAAFLAGLALVGGPAAVQAREIWVAPGGRDGAAGTAAAPLATIQAGLNLAQPGDVVQLAPGRYVQDVVTVRPGRSGAPITINGTRAAVVVGAGKARIVEIKHSWITLNGFTIDGWWNRPTASQASFRDKLIYVLSATPKAGVERLGITNMWLENAGGECVRLRYLVRYAKVAYNRISRCGIYDFVYGAGGKNGEAIYIGTAPEQRADGKNPTADVDVSAKNLVAFNIIDTWGNECVDIKEGSTANTVRRNVCMMQLDVDSAGFDSRGSGNLFEENVSFNNSGAGIRFGGDAATDGINNTARDNVLLDNAGGSFRITRGPQAVCGNTISSGAKVSGGAMNALDPTLACR